MSNTTSQLGDCAVTVVLPTYNRAYCLRRSIDSVLNQTFSNFELIVIDDGSTDNTAELLASIDDPRLRVLRHPTNKGVSAAINSGIRAAASDVIALQDSDDEWLPEKLAKQVSAITSAPAEVGVVYTDRWRIDGAEKTWSRAPHFMPKDGLIYQAALNGAIYNMANQCLMIRRKCFDQIGYFDENIRRHIDKEILIRLSLKYLFIHIPEPLVNYYVTEDSISKKGEAESINAWEIIVAKHLDALKAHPKALAQRTYWIGSYHMRSGDKAKGRFYLTKAFRTHPVNLRYAAAFFASRLGPFAYRYLYQRLK
jgi:glycosyltransferase involved in cell wall biosynthesis